MAIYHFSAKVISRAKGQSAVASASYRSGERLEDERTGEVKFYKRNVQPETMILAPSHSPEWVQDRERLWNEVEKAEKRVNSQLAREINIALPKELSNDHQKELIHDYVQKEFVSKGMVADVAIHRDDKENPHAHVMLTTREISEQGFTVKNREWNDKKLLEQWREQWANHANKALEKEGVQERISHLSNEARGVEQLPTVHLGHVAHQMEKRGVQTERGNINREVQDYNKNIVELDKYKAEKKNLEQQREKGKYLTPSEKADIKEATKSVKGFVTLDKIKDRKAQIDKWEQSIEKQASFTEWKDSKFKEAGDHFHQMDQIQNQVKRLENDIKNINWFNPLKLKENRQTKERAEQAIEKFQKDYSYHDKKLNYHREKLSFSTKEEFMDQRRTFQEEKEKQVTTHFKQKEQIKSECQVLDKAEKALKQGEIRQITAPYPELKTASSFMKYEDALKIKSINEKAGQVVPLSQIKAEIKERTEAIEKAQSHLQTLAKENQKSATAATHFKHLEAVSTKIEKYENNPLMKGKMLFSKTAKEEYRQALSDRERLTKNLESLGFSDKTNFDKHREKLDLAMDKKPLIENTIQEADQGKGNEFNLGFLQAAVQGVEEAQKKEQFERQRQERQKAKQKHKSQENVLER
ncbi:MobQ family relaxase [Mesobacillus sp.]|uniref:MobQ family relaxase n=1 Tax=Mesobacillus sp. TaxID=2675271 RepID=UPI0039EF7FA0